MPTAVWWPGHAAGFGYVGLYGYAGTHNNRIDNHQGSIFEKCTKEMLQTAERRNEECPEQTDSERGVRSESFGARVSEREVRSESFGARSCPTSWMRHGC